jgi:hypothetical protein
MTHAFCTYFDGRYLPRGLAMIESLERHDRSACLWILALDSESERILSALCRPSWRIVSLGQLESWDPRLLRAKTDRSLVEYYFTLTAFLPTFILTSHPNTDLLTYVEADLFFLSSPEPLYEELGHASIGILKHNWDSSHQHMARFGDHNVSWIMYRHDDIALTCLSEYRDQCLAWCRDYPDDGRLADQGYLDTWHQRYPGVRTLIHKGANKASWNLGNHTVTRTETGYRVDDSPLIFFHFHGLTFAESDPFRLSLANSLSPRNEEAVLHLSQLYLHIVNTIEQYLKYRFGYSPEPPLRGSSLPNAV